jgi:hypothetical protein
MLTLAAPFDASPTTLMDIEHDIGEDMLEKFAAIDGILKARQI